MTVVILGSEEDIAAGVNIPQDIQASKPVDDSIALKSDAIDPEIPTKGVKIIGSVKDDTPWYDGLGATIGGIIGGTGGAIIGSAAGPVGTFAGGTAGSAGGSAAGEYIEQVIRNMVDDGYQISDLTEVEVDDIIKEGVIGGAFGGGGVVAGGVIKGSAKLLSKLTGVSEDVTGTILKEGIGGVPGLSIGTHLGKEGLRKATQGGTNMLSKTVNELASKPSVGAATGQITAGVARGGANVYINQLTNSGDIEPYVPKN